MIANIINCRGLYIPTLSFSNTSSKKIDTENEIIITYSFCTKDFYFLTSMGKSYFEEVLTGEGRDNSACWNLTCHPSSVIAKGFKEIPEVELSHTSIEKPIPKTYALQR